MHRIPWFILMVCTGILANAEESGPKPRSPNPLVRALQPVPKDVRVDLAGDPMPLGMRHRLGGTRFKVPGWWRQFGFAGNDDWIWIKADNKLSVIHRESGRVVNQSQLRLDDDPVWNLSVGGDGNRIAIDLSDSLPDANKKTTVRIVIMSTRTTSHIREVTWQSETGALSCICLSDDGQRVLTISYGLELRLWDVESGNSLMTYKLPPSSVRSVALSPTGRSAIIGDANGRAFFWQNLDDPQPPARLSQNQAESVCFAPNGRVFATLARDGVRLWIGADGEHIALLTPKDRPVNYNADFGFAFSPDSTMIAVPVTSMDVIELWNVDSRELVSTLPAAQCRGAKFSRDGRWIAVTGDGSDISIFDLKTGQQVSQPTIGHNDPVRCLRFVDSNSLVSSAAYAFIWDRRTGAQLQRIPNSPKSQVVGLAASCDGKQVAAVSFDDTIRIWDRATASQLHKLKAHGRYGGIRLARFTPDGGELVSWGDDSVLKRWNLTNRSLSASFDFDLLGYKLDPNGLFNGARSQSLTSDTLFVAFAADFFEFDIATGKQRRKLKFERKILALDASEDGNWVATAEGETAPGNSEPSIVIVLRDRASLKAVRQWPVIDAQVVKPSENNAAEGAKVRNEDLRKRHRRQASIAESSGLVFSQDSKYLAWSRIGPHYGIDVAHIDLDRLVTTIPLESASWCLQFSPDGNELATGHYDSTVSLWDWKHASFAVPEK